MGSVDFDPALEMVSFEAHRMVHEKGFILQLIEEDRVEFTKSETTADGTVVTILDCAGAGAIGDPNEAAWTALKKRYGPERDYTSTVHDQTTLAKVLEKVHLLPSPTLRDKGMDIYQSWDELVVTHSNKLTDLEVAFASGERGIVLDDGYTVHHTGGGIFAFYKAHADVAGAYYLLTAGDDGDLDHPADAQVWVVGLYQELEGQENWVFVTEGVTLQEAIDKASTLPLPETFGEPNLEKVFDSWAEVEQLAATPKI